MKIKVIYTGVLSIVTQIVEEEIEVEDSILVNDLVEILLSKYGKPLEAALLDKAAMKLKVPVCINGKFEKGNIELKNNDRVGFMFVVAGG